MRRILLPIAALAAVACLLGACNASFSAVAARVGGVTISQSRFNEDLAAVGSDAGFRCVVTGGGEEQVQGAGTGTYTAAFSAQILTTLIEGQALRDEVARRHLVAGSFSRQLGQSELTAAFAPGGSDDESCTASASSVLGKLPEDVRTSLIGLQADQAVLAAHSAGVALTEAGVSAWAKANPKSATLTCLDLAAFTSKSSASSFASKVASGKGFSATATAAGAEAQSGCVPASSLPSGLGTVVDGVATGHLSAPTSYESEWLVFQVSSRKVATGTEAAELLLNTLSSQGSKVVDEALASARVEIDPAYGSWGKVGSTYQVVPPKVPASGLLLNPSAVTPTTTPAGLG